MPLHSKGLHHLHLRKRIHKNLEEYPHPDKVKRIMDKIMYYFALFGPLMTIPQVVQIWLDQSASGVSVISWIAYTISNFVWLYYGYLHRDKPIIMANLIYLIEDVLVVIGTLIYG